MRNIIEIINKIFARELITNNRFYNSVEGAVLVKKKFFSGEGVNQFFQTAKNLLEVVFF